MFKYSVYKGFVGVYFGQPRLDELDPNIVLYWANTRVKGTATNRQASKLKETVSAEGVTDKFQQEVIPSKLDLRSHGFDGPSEKEAKVTQVGFG